MKINKHKNNYNESGLILLNKELSENIFKKRVILNLSQEEISTATGIGTDQIEKYEKNMDPVTLGILDLIPWLFKNLTNMTFMQSFRRKS